MIEPRLIYASLFLSAFLIIFSIYRFNKLSNYKNWWSLCILPVFFVTGLAVYSLFLPAGIVIHLLFIINLLFTFYYLRNVYFYLIEPGKNTEQIQNFSSYGNFLVIFFISSSLFGFQAFLNISMWLLLFLFAVTVFSVLYEVMVTNEINLNKGGIYIFIFGLIFIEIVIGLYFLPLNHNILGLIMAICYYVLIGLLKFHLKQKLNKQAVKTYLIFGSVGILLILLTAHWR
ncbi:MAG: hypothetical protein ACOCVY_03050 [Patescibacteria group bacterium]